MHPWVIRTWPNCGWPNRTGSAPGVASGYHHSGPLRVSRPTPPSPPSPLSPPPAGAPLAPLAPLAGRRRPAPAEARTLGALR
jgi:hypothetical protein